ncbi:MAG: M15 family metallopeptidase [Cyanobacteriota bacterium]|nr:M15 family metallopeptidase [Cyanobacteriota bacterium]
MTPATTRPWQSIPIADCGEPLQALPPELLRLEPHPYAVLGAPYGPGQSPFQLRSGVISRLLIAQKALAEHDQDLRLAIFDGWRPVAVQEFMVETTIREQCRLAGVDPLQPSPARNRISAEVGRFWAPPSNDPATPPPHSTGAAVDLTIALATGQVLDMGGAIDAIGPVSEPDHFGPQAVSAPGGEAALWHQRRCLLHAVMAAAGFARHPNEWWHFSHGDQLWAWLQQQPEACYGRVDAEPSSSLTR